MEVPFANSDLATLLPTAFWLLLLLPGWALARRLAPRDLEGPLIASVAVAYTTLLACLAPLVALGYLLSLPVWILSALLGAAILWGGFDAVRAGRWRRLGGVLLAAACIEMLVVVADMWLSQRTGAMLGADARIHITRVRFLYEHGLSNLDPFVEARYPYPIYHTNLWHALLASGSRLLAIDPLAMWFGSLAASKLMIASGLAYLAWATLGGRWPAWVAAVMVIAIRGPTTFSLYPNQLAPWFLIPVLAGVLIRAVAPGREEAVEAQPRKAPGALETGLRVAAVAVVVGMFHPLYAGFALVAFAPVMGLAAVVAWWRVRSNSAEDRSRSASMAVVALVVASLPMPLVTQMWTAPWIEVNSPERRAQIRAAERAGDPLSGRIPRRGEEWMHPAPDRGSAGEVVISPDSLLEVPDDAGTEMPLLDDEPEESDEVDSGEGAETPPLGIERAPGFTVFEGTTIARTPGRGFTGGWWRVWSMLLAMAVVIVVRRRVAPLVLVGFIATVLAVMLVPALCTRALRVLGSLWMLQRFETLADVLWIAVSAPAVAAALEPLVRWRWLQSPLSMLAIPLALQHGHFSAPYDWAGYRQRAEAPTDQRFGREFRQLARLQVALQRFLPEGAVVVADPSIGDRLTMLHDVRLVASQRSSTGVTFMRQRTRDVGLMLDGKTREGLRTELFDRYGATHLVERGALRGWVELWARNRAHWGGYAFVELAEEPDWSRVAWKRVRDAERLMRRGRHESARPMLEAALAEIDQTDPGADLVWFRLGNARLWTGDPQAARVAYERAISIRDDDPRFQIMLGNALVEVGEVEASLERFEIAATVALAEDDPSLAASSLFNLGNSQFRLGRWNDAIAAYERALALQPLHPQARYWREEAQREIAFENADSALPESDSEATAPDDQ